MDHSSRELYITIDIIILTQQSFGYADGLNAKRRLEDLVSNGFIILFYFLHINEIRGTWSKPPADDRLQNKAFDRGAEFLDLQDGEGSPVMNYQSQNLRRP